jgi:hypothetical protein
MTIDESWMREICTSSLTRGRDIARQARYAVFRHIRENPETRSTETYPYRCTLSTLPADGTLALERPPRGRKQIWQWPDTWYRSGIRRTWVRLALGIFLQNGSGGTSTGLLAAVNQTVDWVRLPKRFPVRIRITGKPPIPLRIGPDSHRCGISRSFADAAGSLQATLTPSAKTSTCFLHGGQEDWVPKRQSLSVATHVVFVEVTKWIWWQFSIRFEGN